MEASDTVYILLGITGVFMGMSLQTQIARWRRQARKRVRS